MASACTSGPIHAVKLEDILNNYAAAIRWGEFEKAQEFQPPSKRKRLDLAWLKNIHISSYEVLYKKDEQENHILEQKVQIRYFIENTAVEKTFIDQQVWRYDEEHDSLTLQSDLPTFQ